MAVILEDRLTFAEGMFVVCFDHTNPAFTPFVVEPFDALDPSRPVGHRLGFDASKLSLAPSSS